MEKPDEKDFIAFGSSGQYVKALEKYIDYIESELKEKNTVLYDVAENLDDVVNDLLLCEKEKEKYEMCIKLCNPIDGAIKTDFKIFANLTQDGNVVYSIFDEKPIMRDISSIEKFITTLKILLKNENKKT